MSILKENEKTWKTEEIERLTERKRKEALNRKKQVMEGKASERELQMKITQTWNRLPEHEQRHLVKMEEKQRILDLREIKVNIWKKWRREDEQTRNEVKKTHRENKEAWLNKLEHTLEQMQREVEEKRKAKLLYEEKRKKLLDENKKKQENKCVYN